MLVACRQYDMRGYYSAQIDCHMGAQYVTLLYKYYVKSGEDTNLYSPVHITLSLPTQIPSMKELQKRIQDPKLRNRYELPQSIAVTLDIIINERYTSCFSFRNYINYTAEY